MDGKILTGGFEEGDKVEEGDVVLLAPATSSFDQYRNYVERGNDFKRIVGSLA